MELQPPPPPLTTTYRPDALDGFGLFGWLVIAVLLPPISWVATVVYALQNRTLRAVQVGVVAVLATGLDIGLYVASNS